MLGEWVAFRMECVRRRVYYDMQKAKDKLHLLQGLAKILLDIDEAVAYYPSAPKRKGRLSPT